jgi:hypothetical protein
MMAKAAKKSTDPTVVEVDAAKWLGKLKVIGGSKNDDWNSIIANQAVSALWLKNSDIEEAKKQRSATVAALLGIAPRDEIEGMIAAQLVACHNASMECYRRAMIGEQTFEGRRENLSQANKLSRTYATLLEALNRHRGKGAQKVTVEHVHVHEGAQAIVGNVESRGGRVCTENRGSTPCSCTCARHHDAEHGRDAGACVNRRQCRTVAAGCTAEVRRALRWEIKTPSSTDVTRRKQSPAVDLSPS